MSSKSPRPGKATQTGPISDSAHEIWLAGLGAFTKAQQEGSKMFDALVQEGLAMQRKAQATAEEKLSEASQKVSSLAQEIGSRATGQWDKLEGLFEERVARALQRLGMPSVWDVQDIASRLDAIEKKLGAAAPRKTPAAKKVAPAKKAAKKAPARKAPARK